MAVRTTDEGESECRSVMERTSVASVYIDNITERESELTSLFGASHERT
jgi:hypothetical protein